VAVGLALAGDEGRTSKEPEEAPVDLREYLRSAEKEQLIDLLLEHATEDELLRGRLLVDAAGARDSVDAAGYRWTIEDVFNPSEYVDWRSVYAYSQGIERAIDSVEALLEDGHGPEVIELCEHAMDCLEDALGRVDDSDGLLGAIRDRLGSPHACSSESCTRSGTSSTKPPRGMRTSWARPGWPSTGDEPRTSGPGSLPSGQAKIALTHRFGFTSRRSWKQSPSSPVTSTLLSTF